MGMKPPRAGTGRTEYKSDGFCDFDAQRLFLRSGRVRMLEFLIVGVGGFGGCCLRYLISKAMAGAFPDFPFSTLAKITFIAI
jgi:hypothetical protein